MTPAQELVGFWASHVKVGKRDGLTFFATDPQRRKYYNLLIEYLNGIERSPLNACPIPVDNKTLIKRCRRCGASVVWWWYQNGGKVVVAGTCPYCGIEYKPKEDPNNRQMQTVFRRGVEERFGRQCIICGSTQDVEFHHLIPVAACTNAHRPELIGDPKNGVPLCHYHHKMAHGCTK